MSVLDINEDGTTLALKGSVDDITTGGALDINYNTAILDIGNPENTDAPA
jgi:hypothetical protein